MHPGNSYNHFVNRSFIRACRDYFYMIDRNFPERGVLKLVGDRYRLSGDQRTVLYRGIASDKRAHTRRQLLTTEVSGKLLLIDGYNVLFTLINYRFGKITFISTDDILRDAGSLHGKLREYDTLISCIGMLTSCLSSQKPARVEIYLDSPVSHSEKHAILIREQLKQKGVEGECNVLKSADWALRKGSDCILATSDTGIIEKAMLPVVDLPQCILRNSYNAEFLRLSELLTAKETEDAVDES